MLKIETFENHEQTNASSKFRLHHIDLDPAMTFVLNLSGRRRGYRWIRRIANPVLTDGHGN